LAENHHKGSAGGNVQTVYPGTISGKMPHTREAGIATVEFAIVFFLFILLLAGVVEFGHLWYLQHHITRASREGARYAVLYRLDNSTPPQRLILDEQAIKQYLGNGDGEHYPVLGQGFIDYYGVSVQRNISGDDLTVTVTATQNITFLLDGLLNLFNNDFQGISQVTASTTMKLE